MAFQVPLGSSLLLTVVNVAPFKVQSFNGSRKDSDGNLHVLTILKTSK